MSEENSVEETEIEVVPEDTTHKGDDGFIAQLSLRLRYSGIFFVDTTDYGRLMQDIKEVAQDKYNLVTWDSHAGMALWDMDCKTREYIDGTNNPVKAMDLFYSIATGASAEFSAISETTLFVFRFMDANFANMPAALLFIDRLVNVSNYMKKNNINVLFYGPDVKIPEHLKDDAIMLEYNMPGSDVIGNKFDYIHQSSVISVQRKRERGEEVPDFREEVDPEFRAAAVKAALGQSAPMAEATFAYAITRNEFQYNQNYLDLVKHQTMSRIKDIGLVTPVEPKDQDSFDNALGGYDYIEQLVDDDIATIIDPELVHRAKKVPKSSGLLIGGNAGRGKSVCVKAIARKYNLPLIRVDASSIKSKYYGGSEERLRKILNIPRSVFGKGGCLIWFDEADKLIGGFGKGDDSTSGTGKNVLGDILVWMQERKKDDKDWSYVVATFNDGSVFPDAFLRRFSAKVWLHLPTSDDRAKIFELHLQNLGRSLEHFNIDKLVSKSAKFSGAEVEMACETMAKRAFRQNTPDEEEHDLLIQCISEITPDAKNPTDEYTAQENWAKSRNFGNTKYYQERDSAGEEPSGRKIVLDKKNLNPKTKTNGDGH